MSGAGWEVRGEVDINFNPSSNQHEASFLQGAAVD